MAKKKDSALSRREAEGLKTNVFINKDGEVIQKTTVYLPKELVKRLKREALDREITLSELIRERLK